ncbi:hypothetical protein H920_15561 [Fukomys damarensis]|uniref:Uncharacterized protein n=1 Tax=Fukomys damarensis TaxID=885580 RepID=A0A091DJS8_FUKDA|nr:hypothetical protein H920_15561 [Fukomys damarensis]
MEGGRRNEERITDWIPRNEERVGLKRLQTASMERIEPARPTDRQKAQKLALEALNALLKTVAPKGGGILSPGYIKKNSLSLSQ